LLQNCFSAKRIPVKDGDRSAFLGKAERCGSANAGGGACYDGYFGTEAHGLGQYLAIQFYFESFNQAGPHVVEVVRDMLIVAVIVEAFLVFPFFNVRNPTRVIYALVKFVANASRLNVGRPHQDVQGINESVRLAFQCMELSDAYNLRSVVVHHDQLLSETERSISLLSD
jgi:hypothetical protein